MRVLPLLLATLPTASTPFLELLNGRAGRDATLALSNATPFASARFGWSTAGPGPTTFQTPFGALQLAFGSPYQLSELRYCDNLGKTFVTRRVPANATGVTIWAQAMVWDGQALELSNPMVEVIQ